MAVEACNAGNKCDKLKYLRGYHPLSKFLLLVKRKNQPVKIKEDGLCLFMNINALNAVKSLK